MKRRSREDQSTPTVSTFMTDKTDVVQAGMFAVAKFEGLIRA